MDAHSHEGAAAAAAVADTYATPRLEIAVGRQVWGTSAGRRFTGIVSQVNAKTIDVECDGCWLVVLPSDITMVGGTADELPY